MKSIYCIHHCVFEYVCIHLVLRIRLFLLGTDIFHSIIKIYYKAPLLLQLQKRMFKKRTIPKQTNINLNQILDEIGTTPQQQHYPTHRQVNSQYVSDNADGDRDKNINMNRQSSIRQDNANVGAGRRNNMMHLSQEVEHGNQSNAHITADIQNKKLLSTLSQQQQTQKQKQQIEACFAQFIKLQKQQQKNQINKNYNDRYTFNESSENEEQRQKKIEDQSTPFDNVFYSNTRANANVDVEDFLNMGYAEGEMRSEGQDGRGKQMPVIHQVIVEDQSGDHVQLLQINEDYGEISSLQSNSQDNEYGYENELIKRTLTKYNYEKIQESLQTTYKKSNKNKLLKQLQKISYSKVQKKIGKDLRMRRQKRDQLLNQIKYIDNKVMSRKEEIGKKIVNRGELQEKLDKIKRILQVLYYFGSHIDAQDINQQYLQQIIYEPEWKQKIDLIRNTIKKNKQKFQQKRKKVINLDEQSQKERSQASGDVEQLPKHRLGNGWDGWPLDEEGAGQEENIQEVDHDDDDDCFDIDD